MEQLGIDAKLLLAQALNFVVFFFIYKKFIAKPFKKFINQERNKEKEKEALLESVKEKEKALTESYRQYKEKVQKESLKILEKTRAEGEKIKAKVIADGRREAKEIQERARKQIMNERRKMEEEEHNKAIDLAIFLVKKSLDNYLDEGSRKKLTRYILNNSSKLLVNDYEN